jgi:hypothetical protein
MPFVELAGEILGFEEKGVAGRHGAPRGNFIHS